MRTLNNQAKPLDPGKEQHDRLLERQETQPPPPFSPVPPFLPPHPNLIQLRQYFQMSQLDVAKASGVRLFQVYCMERGNACHRMDILRVLRVFSQRTGYHYRIEDVRGLHVRDNDL